MRSFWVSPVGSKSKDKYPCKSMQIRYTENHVQSEAEPGVMELQAKQCLKSPETGRGKGLFPRGFGGNARSAITLG